MLTSVCKLTVVAIMFACWSFINGSCALRLLVIPIDIFSKFVAFTVPEILRPSHCKVGHVTRLRPFVCNFAIFE